MKADLKEEIVSAAKELFYTNGYYNTSLRNVADRLSIHHSNILYYFPNKKALGNVVYGGLYDTISTHMLELLHNKDKYYLATYLRLHYKVMYWDKNIFRLYSDFINEGIVTEYVLPNALRNYRYYTDAFDLDLSDEELSAIFHASQGIEQRFINLIVRHESPVSFEKVIDMILSAPLLYMGVDRGEIKRIIAQSVTNVNRIPNEEVRRIVDELRDAT